MENEKCKETVTLEKKINSLVNEFKSDSYCPECKVHFALRAIFEIVNYSARNEYEAYGILEEVKLGYREILLQIQNEDNELNSNLKENGKLN